MTSDKRYAKIPKRKIRDGLELTEVGLGTWAIGGPWKYGWGAQDDDQSRRSILRALDEGVNWIDTAPAYGLGHAEELVGAVLAESPGRRNDIIIATKCGIVWDSQKNVSFSIAPADIRRECEDSLRRLKIDCIDLYQIHWPDSKTPIVESWAEMMKLKKEGKVKNIGVCNFDMNLLKKCQKLGEISTLQPPYSMLKREIEKEIMPWCKTNGVGILAYSPMQAGLLTGKFNKEYVAGLADGDWRKRNPMFQDPFLSKALAFVDEIRNIGAGYKIDLAAFAVAWVLAHEEVTSAIVGVRNESQATAIAHGAGIRIGDDDMKKINEIYGKIFGNL